LPAPYEALTTARLRLDRLGGSDVDDVYAVFSDPETWRHFPEGCFTRRDQAVAVLDRSESSWAQAGLGQWAVRTAAALDGLAVGTFVGTVSATWLDLGTGMAAWNLGYRLAPATWGRGLATEAAGAALAAAQSVSGTDPVTARALTSNPASIRVLEHLGLPQVWRGASRESIPAGSAPTAFGLPDTTTRERVIHADRAVSPDLLEALISLG
jgi:ribosomal-protein-alanine N-acetyltransferase